MIPLLSASLLLLVRKIPRRSLLKQTSFIEALAVYVLTTAVSFIASFAFPPETWEADATEFSFALELAINILTLLFVLFISTWVINRYAKERFSLKEMFVLQVVLTSGADIVLSFAAVLETFLGQGVITLLGLAFAIYLLLTFQKAISEIALITKAEAAYVILAPMFVLIVVLVAFLAMAGGAATVLQ